MRFSFEISRNAKAAAETPAPAQKRRLSGEVNHPAPDRVKMQMATLRQAVENTRDVNNPDWQELREIYRNSMTDAQVRSQYDIAVNKIQAEPFVVARDGNDDEELTSLFLRPWFSKYLQILFDAEMWGYTVAEFGQKDELNEFIDVKIFPRDNIYPFNRSVIINATDKAGIPYGDDAWKYFLIEIGEPSEIGLLELISREVIWKAFARRDWSELSEKWGKPHLIIRTDAEGAELNKREMAARNFASNAYFITDKEDEIDTLESKTGAAGYQIFEKNIRLIDEQIAKLMNGQTGAADDMAYVGAAEVHERILNDYNSARLRRYSNHINYELIPFLTFHGYPLQAGDRLRFTSLDPKEMPQETEPQPGANDEDENGDQPIPGKSAKNSIKKKRGYTPPW
jgi:hypothetical protein